MPVVAARRTNSVEIPDPHAVRVASLAADLARRVGFVRNEVDIVIEGALLHDLGKTRVPRDILEQRRPLTATEFATVKKHPDWGAALGDGHVRPGALLAIRHHHEWWNGGGYPGRLSEHQIPIEARIVGIADAFTAMREVRPYRPAWSRQAAVGELQRNAGKQFDPSLVEPLIASVIYNRLAANNTLGIDATLLYDDPTPDGSLSTADLQTDTPYNTRINAGLPPTPIASPGEQSLDAALHPANTNYFYYVACPPDGSGRHRFAVTYQQHLQNVQECLGG